MFERLSDWPKSVSLICDITKGNATISLRVYSNHIDASGVRSYTTGWDHHQIQAHGRNDPTTPRLFHLEHLRKILLDLSQIHEQFYAYEVDGAQDYEQEAKLLLTELVGIVITTIKLTVGDTNVSWFLVSLNSSRDIVYWKMRYDGRNRRPGDEHEVQAGT